MTAGCFSTLICLALVASSASAGEEPSALPKDGTWIRYTVSTRQEGVERSGTQTYALVGTKIDSGRVCRWVEIRETRASQQGERVSVLKFLIPEKDLLESDRPLDGLVRSWRRIDERPVQALEYETLRSIATAPHFAFGQLFLIFPGVQKKAQPLDEPRTVEYQTGQFRIPKGRAGQVLATRQAVTAPVTQTIVVDFRAWFDPALPLGPAEWREDLTLLRNGDPLTTQQSAFVVQDFGTDAKTALPDND